MDAIESGLQAVQGVLNNQVASPWASAAAIAIAVYRLAKPLIDDWQKARKERAELLNNQSLSYKALFDFSQERSLEALKEWQEQEEQYKEKIKQLSTHILDLQKHIALLQKQAASIGNVTQSGEADPPTEIV